MTEPKQSFTEEVQKEAEERYRPFFNQSSYDENALRRSTFIEGANVALSILSRKTEGREFYLGKQVFHTAADAKYLVEECQSKYSEFTHVIEYSALVAERARVRFLEDEMIRVLSEHSVEADKMKTEITTLRAQNDHLRKVITGADNIYKEDKQKLQRQVEQLKDQLELCKEQRNYLSLYRANDQYDCSDEIKQYDLELQKKGQGDE